MEDQKNNVLVSVLVFNIVVMAYMGFQWFCNTGDAEFSLWNWPIAMLLASAAACGTFFVMKKK